jgi:hypothetical protein
VLCSLIVPHNKRERIYNNIAGKANDLGIASYKVEHRPNFYLGKVKCAAESI